MKASIFTRCILTLIIFILSVKGQKEPTTPTPFHPTSQPVFDGSVNIELPESIIPEDVPTNKGQDDKDNSVLYVNQQQYNFAEDDPTNPALNSIHDPVKNKANGPPFDPDQYNNFGGLATSDLYRMLAIGPQQSDPGAGFRFHGFFDRMGPEPKADFENLDHCPERPEIGIQYYCMKLEDGLYYDPWNPWCGFIRCNEGVAERVCCKQGTWLGIANLRQSNQKEMCRRPLNAKLIGDKCPIPNTLDLCRSAIKVEKMNPPKKKVQVSISQFVRSQNAKSATMNVGLGQEPINIPINVQAKDSKPKPIEAKQDGQSDK